MNPSPTNSSTPNEPGIALWRPSKGQASSSLWSEFENYCGVKERLQEFSVDQPDQFWQQLWHWADVIGELEGVEPYDSSEPLWRQNFMSGASLNFAENLLRPHDGVPPESAALISVREDSANIELSWDDLRKRVASLARALKGMGVEPGDIVAAWLPNLSETVIAFLASAAIGAVFTSTSADFGPDAVIERFGQTSPKVLFAADGYRYNGRDFRLRSKLNQIKQRLPTLEHVVVIPNLNRDGEVQVGETNWPDLFSGNDDTPLEFQQFSTDHPIFVLYSSGTTGKPKCIVHRAGGILLKHLSEHRLHCNVRPGDTMLYYTTCGWMMWNWQVTALASGATIVLYEGNPVYQSEAKLFQLVDDLQVSLLGVSAKFIETVAKSGIRPNVLASLTSLKTVCSTGSPLSDENFRWAYRNIKADMHLASISGGTDLCGCLVLGNPVKPVFAGEIQGAALGLKIEIFDEQGLPCKVAEKGELVCLTAFPSMPLCFWADPDGSKYLNSYFAKYKNVWKQGDYASKTENGGFIIHGRSDATLNVSGVRIGTAEIYTATDQIDEIVEAVAASQEGNETSRIVLFVVLSEGLILDESLENKIRSKIRKSCSPRHVPAVIGQVFEIPRTMSGKVVEMAVAAAMNGNEISNKNALANPEAIAQFVDHPATSWN